MIVLINSDRRKQDSPEKLALWAWGMGCYFGRVCSAEFEEGRDKIKDKYKDWKGELKWVNRYSFILGLHNSRDEKFLDGVGEEIANNNLSGEEESCLEKETKRLRLSRNTILWSNATWNLFGGKEYWSFLRNENYKSDEILWLDEIFYAEIFPIGIPEDSDSVRERGKDIFVTDIENLIKEEHIKFLEEQLEEINKKIEEEK